MLKKPLADILKTTKKHLFALEQLNIKTVEDLLLYFPRTYNDNSQYTKINSVRLEDKNTIQGKISNLVTIKTKFGKKMVKGVFCDETGTIPVLWFNQEHLFKLLPRNKTLILSGKVKFSFGKNTLVNPDYEIMDASGEQLHTGRIIPIYHENEIINSKWLREKIKPILDVFYKHFEEYLPQEIIDSEKLINISSAIKEIHYPSSSELLKQARDRLAFDELFILQLKILQKKWFWQNINKREINHLEQKSEILRECISNLPFELTNAQKRVLNEILSDLQKNIPMSRLLQGDVGSGKTIIAALSALNVIKNNYQTCVMAPTEILAKQHYLTFMKLLNKYNINIQYISGSTPKKTKDEIINQMKTGTVDIVIGTHSLIQEDISFHKLGLAIIDEQHRFGVEQRNKLKSYGTPHLLSMTATPIPRTLAMTIYGDQDLSIIDEMPEGRQITTTKIVPENKRTLAYRWIENQIPKGRQAFIICPLIEESEVLDLKSVIKEYEHLKENIFPNLKIGLLHGRLKQEEKDTIMGKFKNNELNILVSTSVIEVGIDIPNATIMVIEGSERFGLSQLHQFRGRVGRGEHKSYCFLFTGKINQDSLIRLKAMEKYTDGFKLSEIDLKLRGPGEIYGLKQSGIPDLKLASLTDSYNIERARNVAYKIIEKDPNLINYEKLNNKINNINEIYFNE